MENTYVGPFLIIKKLGTRRQKVYHARQTEQNRDVALKFISVPPNVEWVKVLDKIDREVSELQKLRHPNLVQVYGAGVEGERVFFATELVEGESLASILARRGKLTPDLVVEYGHQISEFLRYLHGQDLIHSKLTPDKIIITPDHKIKISDLRLNRSRRRRWDSTRRRELDLAAYMAPEQFTEGASPKSDFYSLGVILYEVLTGKLPYEPDTMGRMTKMKMNAPVPSVAADVMNCPIWLDKIVTQMLSPNPKKRPHSARAISFAFEEIKKIASTKKSAVSQMTGGFNPLTAGQDKSEARQLLGIKKPKKKSGTEVPFYQRIPFQAAALVAIFALTIPFLIPKSQTSIIDEANKLIATNSTTEWSKARELLKPIMEGSGKKAEEASKLYYTARRKTLVRHAEEGLSNRLQSENVQLFGKAVRLEEDNKNDQAIDIYTELMEHVDPKGKEQHVYYEAEHRIQQLVNKSTLPVTHGELSDLIAKAKTASTRSQLMDAHTVLSDITLEFVGEDGYEEIVRIASEELQAVKEKLSEDTSESGEFTDVSDRGETGTQELPDAQ